VLELLALTFGGMMLAVAAMAVGLTRGRPLEGGCGRGHSELLGCPCVVCALACERGGAPSRIPREKRP
jgi:hypothetical protein